MTMIENILSTYDTATADDVHAGMTWYLAANALAWEIDPARPWQGAGVIAALSPRLSWEKNALYARIAYDLKGYDLKDVDNYIPTLKTSRIKALRMVNGEHVSMVLGKGLKTNSFWHNILHPYNSEHVTVDKHAANIAMGKRTGYDISIKDKDYRIIAAAYREAARIANIAPLQMQAITWVAWRNK